MKAHKYRVKVRIILNNPVYSTVSDLTDRLENFILKLSVKMEMKLFSLILCFLSNASVNIFEE